VQGSVLAVLIVAFNIIYRANPWIFHDETDQREAWKLYIKSLGVIGGALFLMTRGKLRSEN
jgi:hypothetical protein